MKILQVCAIDSTAWVLLRTQLIGMRDRGWAVHVACSDGPNLSRLRELGMTTHVVAIARNTDIRAHAKAVLSLWRLIRQERFEIVHVHTPVAALIGRLAAWLARVPLVLYTAHGFYFHDDMVPRQRNRHVWLERIFGRLTHHLFTQSSEDGVTAVKEGIMPEGAVTVIGNGVLLEQFHDVPGADIARWRQKLGIPDGACVVGIVGRLVEEKGFREFFLAAREVLDAHPEAAFLVVGGEVQGDRDTFQAEIAGFLEDPALRSRTFFSGFTEDIPVLMNLMDIFVLPSYREGMPRSIIEAMAASKPVIATNIRGCREEVVEGETGFLVPRGDAVALADRIKRLIVDADQRKDFGGAGWRRAQEQFHERMVLDRLLGRIEELLAHRAPVG